jgi:hypothetical protein
LAECAGGSGSVRIAGEAGIVSLIEWLGGNSVSHDGEVLTGAGKLDGGFGGGTVFAGDGDVGSGGGLRQDEGIDEGGAGGSGGLVLEESEGRGLIVSVAAGGTIARAVAGSVGDVGASAAVDTAALDGDDDVAGGEQGRGFGNGVYAGREIGVREVGLLGEDGEGRKEKRRCEEREISTLSWGHGGLFLGGLRVAKLCQRNGRKRALF